MWGTSNLVCVQVWGSVSSLWRKGSWRTAGMEEPLIWFNRLYRTFTSNFCLLLYQPLIHSYSTFPFTFSRQPELWSSVRTCPVCGSCWVTPALLSALRPPTELRFKSQVRWLALTPTARSTCWTRLRHSKLARGITSACFTLGRLQHTSYFHITCSIYLLLSVFVRRCYVRALKLMPEVPSLWYDLGINYHRQVTCSLCFLWHTHFHLE